MNMIIANMMTMVATSSNASTTTLMIAGTLSSTVLGLLKSLALLELNTTNVELALSLIDS